MARNNAGNLNKLYWPPKRTINYKFDEELETSIPLYDGVNKDYNKDNEYAD